jgi:hypothetical protein
MIYCYTCTYVNKYASEIYYALKALINHPITKQNEYNILSIGCGDCADLFGIKQFFIYAKREPAISYTGIDINTRWRPIHEQIVAQSQNINFAFKYQDAFEYLNTLDEVPFNMVIMEYVLNEVRKYSPDIINAFINSLVHRAIDRLPANSLLVINDINHVMVRQYYPIIKNKAIINNNIKEGALRFLNPTSHDYGGAIMKKDNLVFSISNNSFQEKAPCSSSIYLLFKENSHDS